MKAASRVRGRFPAPTVYCTRYPIRNVIHCVLWMHYTHYIHYLYTIDDICMIHKIYTMHIRYCRLELTRLAYYILCCYTVYYYTLEYCRLY